MRRNATGRRSLTPFWIGMIAIVLIALAWYLAFAPSKPWSGGTEIKAVVAQSNELGSRSPVRIAGVEVGKVKKVEPGPGKTSIVTMKLKDEALPLHEDATLKVRPRIFLEGNFFLDLEPGTPGAPRLEAGDTIPLANTATPVQLDQVLSGLRSDTRKSLKALLSEYAEAMDKGGAQALQGTFKPAGPAFTQLALGLEATRGQRLHDLSEFIRFGGQTAGAAASPERLSELITGFNRTARALADQQANTSASLRGLDSTLAEARPALDALNKAFPPTRAFAREVRPGLRAAPETLDLANPLLRQLEALLSKRELPALVAELDPAVRSLSRLEPSLVKLFAQVTPVTECLRTKAVPTLKLPVDDGQHTTGAPNYRELLYGFVGLSSAAQNFTGSGPAVRYHAGLGEQTVTLGPAGNTQDPLKGIAAQPIVGSRPRKPPQRPPFRPDVPCATQERVDLAAETGPAPQQASANFKLKPLPPLDDEATYSEIYDALGVKAPKWLEDEDRK